MMAVYHRAWPRPPMDVLISVDRTAEQAWADWLTATLEPKGLAVRRVRSDEDALRIVRGDRPSLAVLDTRVPRIGGLGLLRRIRSIDASLPCVLVAGRIDCRYLRRALELRAYSVVTAPVDREVLRNLIAMAFRRFYQSELGL